MTDLEIHGLEKCINSLGEKFLRYPYNFFTESDAHSFLFYYIFRYATREFKVQYPTNDGNRTVLVHREYPTAFRYRKDAMELDKKGGRGHYDLVVLNPDFVKYHSMRQVIAKDYRQTQVDEKHHLLAAIEFKFIHKTLGAGMRDEIRKDILKLSWSLETQPEQCMPQCKHAYALIFNRHQPAEYFRDVELAEYSDKNKGVKILYIESIPGKDRRYEIRYFQDWTDQLRFASKK
jgi:hypothetical protein